MQCDEAQPVCSRCQRNRWPCTYLQATFQRRRAVESRSRLSYEHVSTSLITLMPSIVPSAHIGTPPDYLIQHLARYQSQIISAPGSDEIISLFRSNLLVRNTVLAVAACHLRHVAPHLVEHRIAEHLRLYIVLQDYQRVLDQPMEALGQTEANALLLSGALLTTLAFALPYNEDSIQHDGGLDLERSWVFSSDEHRLDWLALQAGLRPVMVSACMAEYLDEGITFLCRILLGVKVRQRNFFHPNPDNVSELWSKFFELESDKGKVFRAPVSTISELRRIEPDANSVFRYLQFLGKVTPAFKTLLSNWDEKAMWLFGYWLGMMCRFEDIWWCNRRGRRDYNAIRTWFKQRHIAERPVAERHVWQMMMQELQSASLF